ncbi:reverse transcriptase domain-containing protein [Tanacetum coccineum]
MVTPVEKRSSNKFCDFHNDKGHSTDECIQLKKQIEELVRAGKLSHLIKEIKQGRDQPKVGKKEVPAKDKSMAIYMVQPWHRMTRQKVTQSFTRVSEITFPPLATRDAEHSTKAWMNFMIVRSLSPYNGIIRRPGIREIQAVPSTTHRMLKFPVDGGIVTIRSTILIPTECATMTTSSKEILKEAEKKRGQATERAKAIQAKVQKLVEVGIMREVYYHDWLSNLVMVKKHDSSWRMCVDFTDLNKACYHQIHIAESDEEKTAFHTSHRVYCYTKMPFGLKNAGATYQRLVDKAFDNQVGRNIEVYVDDLVIKSHTETEMLRDMDETFRTLRKINMKLNPKRCTFEAVEGMFLGYKISPEGIKPCPNQTEVVLRLSSPRIIKEIQSLNGKLASLNIFLSKSVEKSLPLFKTLKKCIKKSYFHWTPEEE